MKNLNRKICRTINRISFIIIIISVTSCQFERTYDEPLFLSFTRSNDIWIMNMDGEELRQLTTTANNDYSSWSPDGTRIVFQSGRDGNDEIFIMNMDGSGQTQLTFTTSPDFCRYPTFMPDGESIVCYRKSGASYFFYIIKTDSTFIRQVPASSSLLALSVSPDGKYFAIVDGPNQISRTETDTGTQVTFVSASSKFYPSWSPGGDCLVITSSSNIALVDSSAVLPVTPMVIFTGTTCNSTVWSPDSESIFFTNVGSNICRIKSDGSNYQVLTTSFTASNLCVQGKPR